MSAKEIFAYRRDGQIDKAYEYAKQDLVHSPGDLWIKRAFAWVLLDYVKKATEENNFELFEGYSKEFFDLELTIEEKMVYENYSWIIYKWLSKLHELTKDIDNKTKFLDDDSPINKMIRTTFCYISKIKLEKPNKLFTILHRLSTKLFPKWEDLEWFGLDFFMADDYLPYESKDGKKLLSYVEKAFIFHAKKILNKELVFNLVNKDYPRHMENYKLIVNPERVKKFLPFLDEMINKHPEYIYLPFYKAKLLIASNDDGEDILKTFIPFARKKKYEFWVWDLLSDIFTVNDIRKLACLCKSLTCKTNEEFLVKTHQKMADLLIKLEFFNEAKTEIIRVLEIRRKNNWSIPPVIVSWIQAEWFKSALFNENNSTFYGNHMNQAEEILLDGLPYQIVAVEFVNSDKRIINFINEEKKTGHCKYSGLIDKIQIGDVLKIIFEKPFEEGYNNAISIRKSEVNISENIVKEFNGMLTIPSNQNFGFVNREIFVDPSIIEKNALENNQQIEGVAISSFNKQKNSWGWKAIRIN